MQFHIISLFLVHWFKLQLNDVVMGAQGADIHSLCKKGVSYIKLEQPNKCIIPHIDLAAPKNTIRGHNHLVLSRLLCPVRYLSEFDANPDEWVYFENPWSLLMQFLSKILYKTP